jgi:hypothetical protein
MALSGSGIMPVTSQKDMRPEESVRKMNTRREVAMVL